jgi:membrane associated rhomboid family serine protease
MVKAIIIACVVVWLAQYLASDVFGQNLAQHLGVVPAMLIRGAIWQPFTYMFLHSQASPMHLLLNMLMVWMFGGALERHWGSRAFLRYFLVCGVAGGLGAAVLGLLVGASRVPTIGASGAVFGLCVAYGIVFAERTVLFMMFFPMKARTMALLMVGLNLYYLLSDRGAGGISHIAHITGALAGYLYLRRVWNFGPFWRELRWRWRRRRFKLMPPKDPPDRWLN